MLLYVNSHLEITGTTVTVTGSFMSDTDLKPTEDIYRERDFLNCVVLFTLMGLFAPCQVSSLYGFWI